MGSLSEDEGSLFFDAQDDLSLVSDNDFDDGELSDSACGYNDLAVSSFDAWRETPVSVKERRGKFLNWWFSDRVSGEVLGDLCESGALEERLEGLRDGGGSMLKSSESGFESVVLDRCNRNSDFDSTVERREEGSFVSRNGNLEGLMEDSNGRIGQDRMGKEGSDSGLVMNEESQQLVQEVADEANVPIEPVKRVKKGWLSRLRSIAGILDRQEQGNDLRPYDDGDDDMTTGSKLRRVKVRKHGKRSKELSALYMGQNIKAHEGSIVAMKFSPDGQYLGTAGEDGIVRIWQVVEEESCNEFDIIDADPSSLYFKENNLSRLSPLVVDKEKSSKLKSGRKSCDSACVIFPQKVFRILEKPLHEFRGHNGEIIDLCWSNNNFLLSSSVDETVRLWQVGCDHCLEVFLHTNYVTSVQFNPVDDNYFMSGSIDGKVRIWSISSCQVVDWTDIKEIVTAVCYRPDGQGGIIGTLTGNCRFYNISDNLLKLDAQISLTSKKKAPCKRITGFQFFPHDPSKVMVSCADSRVMILHDLNVISKYRGLHNAGNHTSATFTSDGKHIISACEDSNVYMWKLNGLGDSTSSQVKKSQSCEYFSANASVAIPWCGLKDGNSGRMNLRNGWECRRSNDSSLEMFPFAKRSCFFLSPDFLSESFSKGSATWPEEKLPESSVFSNSLAVHMSNYEVLKKSCQSSSDAWGLAIVTAGWDGRIRSFYNYGLPVTT